MKNMPKEINKRLNALLLEVHESIVLDIRNAIEKEFLQDDKGFQTREFKFKYITEEIKISITVPEILFLQEGEKIFEDSLPEHFVTKCK